MLFKNDHRSPGHLSQTAVAAAVILMLASCGQQDQAAPDVTTGPPSAAQGRFDQIPGQFPEQPNDIPGAHLAPVGACVNLGGPSTAATLIIVECGSPANGYKVIQRVATPDHCVKDADQRFYMNSTEGQFTACLDYAWSSSDCLAIGKLVATRTKCNDASVPNRERPIQTILNSSTTNGCSSGGFAHPVRHFTICTETQK